MLIAFSFLLEMGGPAGAAVITVTTLLDSKVPPIAGSLRTAVGSANPGDTIAFAVTGTIVMVGELTINKDITIQGPGAENLAIDGGNVARIFHFTGGTVTIDGLTIQNGLAPDFGLFLGSGGGIWNEGGTLTLSNCTLSGNSTIGFASGAGIFNQGMMTVSNCTLYSNSTGSGGVGGGILNFGGSMTLSNCTLSGNSAYGGGGVFNQGTMTVSNCTFSGNSASNFGGGIDTVGTMMVSNCTLSGNSAAIGGGIYNSSTLTMSNCTLSGNWATVNGGGGGINNDFELTLTDTILANSPAGGNYAGPFFSTSFGYNVDSDGTCGLTGPGDLSGVDPLLGILQDNGGPTLTHALLPGSPAIGAGNPGATSLSTDQRGTGFDRVVGGRIDIGAFEVQSADLAVTKQAVKTRLTKGYTQFTYTITVHNLGPGPASGVVLTDPVPAKTTFVNVSSSQGACYVVSSGVVTCEVGNLAIGAAATVTIDVAVTVKGKTITNTATVSSTSSDPNPANNSATIQTK